MLCSYLYRYRFLFCSSDIFSNETFNDAEGLLNTERNISNGKNHRTGLSVNIPYERPNQQLRKMEKFVIIRLLHNPSMVNPPIDENIEQMIKKTYQL